MSNIANEIKVIGANEPILLDNPNEILLIRKGYVDVFAVLLNEDQSWGKRYYLFQIAVGGALFGIDSSNYNFRLIGVALNNTQIQKYPSNILLPNTQQDIYQRQKIAIDHLYLLEEWIKSLINTIIPKKNFANKPIYSKLAENDLLEKQTIVPGDYRLYWCTIVSGSVKANYFNETILANEDAFFPFATPMFLEATQNSSIKIVGSTEWLTKNYSYKDLAAFYKMVFDNISKKIELIEQGIIRDIKNKKYINKLVRSQPLRAIRTLFFPKKTTKIYTAPTPLLQAIQKISELQGFTIELSHTIQIENNTDINSMPLENLANKMGIRLRKVLLKGKWWQSSSVPMLACTKNNDICVLEPRNNSKFRLHYIKEEKSVIVDKNIALTLLSEAFAFYAPNQKPKLEWTDIIRISFRKNIREIIRILLVTFVIASLGALTPIIIGIAFNQVVPTSNLNLHFQVISLLVAALLTSGVFTAIQIANKLHIKTKMCHELQTFVWDRILRFPVNFFKDFTVGDLAYRIESFDRFLKIFIEAFIKIVTSIIFAIVSIALLFYYQPFLATLAVMISALSVVVHTVFSIFISYHNEKIYGLEAQTDSLATQFFSNIAKIRNNVSEDRAYAKWINTFTKNIRHTMRFTQLQNIDNIFDITLNVLAILIFFGAIITHAQSMLTGNVIAFLSAFTLLTMSLTVINNNIQHVLMVRRNFKFITPILSTSPEDIAIKEAPSTLKGDIQIKNLYFKYTDDSPLVLKNISLHIHPGEFVAIVGPSGCGKSTLLRLLLNFEQVTSGEILYDGIKINDLDIRALRRQFGVVLQNSALATASIYENISSTNNTITLADAWEASKFSGIDTFISSLPMQMQTLIMEGGNMFSGGQRQQLMLARAIARKAPILFLDEASSALDNHTQELVSSNLKKMDNTRIVVAHRLSTVVTADTIYVMKDGAVVQKGNYSQLINEESGLFAKLAKRQLL